MRFNLAQIKVMLRKKDIDVLNGMAAREWSVQ